MDVNSLMTVSGVRNSCETLSTNWWAVSYSSDRRAFLPLQCLLGHLEFGQQTPILSLDASAGLLSACVADRSFEDVRAQVVLGHVVVGAGAGQLCGDVLVTLPRHDDDRSHVAVRAHGLEHVQRGLGAELIVQEQKAHVSPREPCATALGVGAVQELDFHIRDELEVTPEDFSVADVVVDREHEQRVCRRVIGHGSREDLPCPDAVSPAVLGFAQGLVGLASDVLPAFGRRSRPRRCSPLPAPPPRWPDGPERGPRLPCESAHPARVPPRHRSPARARTNAPPP